MKKNLHSLLNGNIDSGSPEDVVEGTVDISPEIVEVQDVQNELQDDIHENEVIGDSISSVEEDVSSIEEDVTNLEEEVNTNPEYVADPVTVESIRRRLDALQKYGIILDGSIVSKESFKAVPPESKREATVTLLGDIKSALTKAKSKIAEWIKMFLKKLYESTKGIFGKITRLKSAVASLRKKVNSIDWSQDVPNVEGSIEFAHKFPHQKDPVLEIHNVTEESNKLIDYINKFMDFPKNMSSMIDMFIVAVKDKDHRGAGNIDFNALFTFKHPTDLNKIYLCKYMTLNITSPNKSMEVKTGSSNFNGNSISYKAPSKEEVVELVDSLSNLVVTLEKVIESNQDEIEKEIQRVEEVTSAPDFGSEFVAIGIPNTLNYVNKAFNDIVSLYTMSSFALVGDSIRYIDVLAKAQNQ